MKWKKYAFESLSIFIAVLSAFALNNWNDNKKNELAESRILFEISNGLTKDLEDVKLNRFGHNLGVSSFQYWRGMVNGDSVSQDSLVIQYARFTCDLLGRSW